MGEKWDKDATASEKALKLYSILLFSGKQYTLTQLSQKLKCSKQTIERMIKHLESRHEHLGDLLEKGKEGRERWYKLKIPSLRPKLCLTPADIQQLVMCRDIMLHLLPKNMQERLGKAVDASTTLLTDFEQRDKALEHVYLHEIKGRIDYEPFTTVLKALDKSIRNRCLCLISYQALGKEEPREHHYAPLALISHKDSFYAKGVKVTDKPPWEEVGPMLLAVQRIRDVTLLRPTHTFRTPSEETVTFGLIKGEPFQVRTRFIEIAATYARERTWSNDQTIETCDDGSIILAFTATSPEEVLSWVLSFGESAELLEPEDLREELARQSAVLAERYRTRLRK